MGWWLWYSVKLGPVLLVLAVPSMALGDQIEDLSCGRLQSPSVMCEGIEQLEISDEEALRYEPINIRAVEREAVQRAVSPPVISQVGGPSGLPIIGGAADHSRAPFSTVRPLPRPDLSNRESRWPKPVSPYPAPPRPISIVENEVVEAAASGEEEGFFSLPAGTFRGLKLRSSSGNSLNAIFWLKGDGYFNDFLVEVNDFFASLTLSRPSVSWSQVEDIYAAFHILNRDNLGANYQYAQASPLVIISVEASGPKVLGVDFFWREGVSISAFAEITESVIADVSSLHDRVGDLSPGVLRLNWSDAEAGGETHTNGPGNEDFPPLVTSDIEVMDAKLVDVVSKIAAECLIGDIGELGKEYRNEGDPRFEMDDDAVYDLRLPDGRTLGKVVWFGGVSCNGGRYWCAPGACPSTVIIDGRAYDFWGGRPQLVLYGETPVILVGISGSSCSSEQQNLGNVSSCVQAAAWDRESGLNFTFRQFDFDSRYND